MSGCSQGNLIYLDNNATTPLLPSVKEAIVEAMQCFGNPSSVHIAGRQSKKVYETSRSMVAEMIGANADEIIFTSGGTEANNLAIIGYCSQFKKGHIITSLIEHPSVLNPVIRLQQMGYEVSFVKPNPTGTVEPDEIQKALRADTILVSIMHANNETGALQPIKEISELLKDTDVVFHTDADQSIGKVPVKVDELGVDLLTIVPHKFHGPKGIGALYIRKGIKLNPLLYGASQEKGLRPGTENLILSHGFATACRLVSENLHERQIFLEDITLCLLNELTSAIPSIELNTLDAKRVPNTLNLYIPDVEGYKLVEKLKDKVAISTGSACHEGNTKGSEVLLAMGLSQTRAVCSIRVSTGMLNTKDEIYAAVDLIVQAIRDLTNN